MHLRLVLLCLGAVVVVGCNPNPNSPEELPPGVGLGASCETDRCRAGLACTEARTCEGHGVTPDGQECILGVECGSGYCAPNGRRGVCAPGGTKLTSEACEGDGDCAPPLRCGFDGVTLSPRCLTQGRKDLGAECTIATECAQGLMCVTGKCGISPFTSMTAPHGQPPALPRSGTQAWAGATCATPKTSAEKALFVLPRESDDEATRSDFYRLPYPSDAARDANGRIDFTRHPKDPAPVFGFDLLGRYLDLLGNEPFSAAPTVLLRFDGPVEFTSIDVRSANPNIRLVKLETGEGYAHGLNVHLNTSRNRYICENWLAVRPYVGESLSEGTWAVVALKGLKGTNGVEVAASDDFIAMMRDTTPPDAVQDAAWPKFAKLRTWATEQNLTRDQVINAAVFTVGNPRRMVDSLAAAVAAQPTPAASTWVKCGGNTPSPCPDVSGSRACGTTAGVDEWHALISLPVFQKGEAPYLSPAQGGDLSTSVVRTEQVCASLMIPSGAAPAGGWKVVLYAHGTGGNFRDQPSTAATVAMFGFDQVGHGPRRGVNGQTRSPDDVVFNFANPLSARGTMAQGAADLLSMTKYVKNLNAPELPALDTSRVVFWGHSQGATEGALFLARDVAIDGAVLSGASANLTEALTSKKAPVDLTSVLWSALGEGAPASVTVNHPVLGLMQQWSDVVDPLHFAAADVSSTTYARHVFQVWGRDDLFTAKNVQTAFAMGARLRLVGPTVDEFPLTAVDSVTGNITLPRLTTAALRQYAPDGYDGHFVAFRNETAKRDVSRFITSVLNGNVPVVPEP
ncbi:MAG: hypothetical protein ACO1OB_05740 [Archangium sp.]